MVAERSFDVVVIGGGFAGLAAAARSAEMGLKAAVLEKGGDSAYLCNSRVSGGVFHIAHEDVTKPAADVLAAIRKSTGGRGEPALQEALANNAGPTMAWAQRLGASFIRAGEHAMNTLMAAPPRPLDEPLDWMTSWKGRGPDMLLRLLTQTLQKHGGELILGTRARSLVMEGGVCVGVDAIGESGETRYRAKAVVIADGGFQNNPDLLRTHIAPQPEGVCGRNAGTAAGDGLRMAQEAGAGLTSLKGFYGHVLSRDAVKNPLLWPYPLLDDLCVRGLVVDGQGQRFVDEGKGGVFIANSIAGRANPLDSLVIFDAAIWHQTGLREHVSTPNPKLLKLGGTVYSASSLAELAQITGMPATALEATIQAYNQAVNDGVAIDPPRSQGKQKPMPVLTAPFYAVPAAAGITFTMGGIRINAHAQVLDTAGAVMPGLYAAGSATGGVDIGEHAIYVSGVSKALVFGKIAADHILSERPQPTQATQNQATQAQITLPISTATPYPSLAMVARHGQAISLIMALVPVLIGGVVASQLSGSLQTIAALAGLVLGGVAYLVTKILIELIQLIIRTLLPAGFEPD